MQTSTPPMRRQQQNSGLNHYLTLIANFVEISSSRASPSGFLPLGECCFL